MVGIVIVAHSEGVAATVKDLVEHLSQGKAAVAAAGGVEEGGFGTSVPAVLEAIESVYGEDGVVVLMDMGSSLLSAEMALDFVECSKRENIRLCEAALVEGAVSAAVCAAGGGSLEQVVIEARGALEAKKSHLAGSRGPETGGAAPGGTQAGAALEPGTRSESGAARELTLTVRNRLGIHARPAARLVQAASGFHSEMTVRNLSKRSGAVSMKSVNLLATLDVAKGETIVVAARGPDAEEALEAVRSLVETNFGEPHGEPAEKTPVPASRETAVEDSVSIPPDAGFQPASEGKPASGAAAVGMSLRGIPCSPGVASGPAVVRAYHVPAVSGTGRDESASFDPAVEWRRLEDALSRVKGEMTALRDRVSQELDAYTGSMYEAYALTLEDPALREKAREFIFEERRAAEEAWALTTEWIASKYKGASSELLRLRAADVDDVRNRVLESLAGRTLEPAGTAGGESGMSLLVVRDLSAADVALLDAETVLGICTAEGGAQSHAAIFARAVSLPMVAGLGPRLLRIEDGTLLALDGSTGEVTWDPERVREMEGRRAAAGGSKSGSMGPRGRGPAEGGAIRREGGRDDAEVVKKRTAPSCTLDGRRVEVCANASSLAEIRAAARLGADGIGVLRTEFLFVKRRGAPSEEEQFTLYESMARALGNRTLTVRTLDAGGDKSIPYLSMEREENPFLGVRGIRLSLRNPVLFLEQLRAILRVSANHPVRILLPMISCVEEVSRARELLEEARSGLAGRGIACCGEVPLGIMVEVPSAVLISERLAQEAAFFSIGTNDLAQYTLAADRTNRNVAGLGDALHPAVLWMIERCVKAGRRAGIGVSVCGEMARDRAAVPVLLGLGVEGLSVSPDAIPEVRSLIEKIAVRDAEALASRALVAASSTDVRASVDRFFETGIAGI